MFNPNNLPLKTDFDAKATEFLEIALADIASGNLFLARSYLRDALKFSNKAGTKRRSGFIMLALARLKVA